MGCTHTSRLDASARVSFNAVLSKKYIYSAKSMIASVSADHYTQPLSMGNRRLLMLFTAPSVWGTLPACPPACLPACSTALGVWAPLGWPSPFELALMFLFLILAAVVGKWTVEVCMSCPVNTVLAAFQGIRQ